MCSFRSTRNVLGSRWPMLLLVLGVLLFGVSCGDFAIFEDDGGPCDEDPCAEIDNAVAESCVADGTDDFTCDCDDHFEWDDASNQCQAADLCADDPCAGIENAVEGSCDPAGTDDFTCDCETDFTWSDGSNTCVSSLEGTCTDLKGCLTACDWDDAPCQLECQSQWTGCDCGEIDPVDPPVECAFDCLAECADLLSQTCYVCLVGCGIDTYCQ